MAQRKGWLLLTNDEGIEAVGGCWSSAHKAGYPVAVLAPSGNHSATGANQPHEPKALENAKIWLTAGN